MVFFYFQSTFSSSLNYLFYASASHPLSIINAQLTVFLFSKHSRCFFSFKSFFERADYISCKHSLKKVWFVVQIPRLLHFQVATVSVESFYLLLCQVEISCVEWLSIYSPLGEDEEKCSFELITILFLRSICRSFLFPGIVYQFLSFSAITLYTILLYLLNLFFSLKRVINTH